ncbi:MAG TPA: TolC family protein [Vicinamibacterales bacterium]|nr:TolC family protein [Vicinamibacterales bacterium]
MDQRFSFSAQWNIVAVVVSAVGVCSCVRYEAKPIAPTVPLATIESRSTDDSRLREFLMQHGVPGTNPLHWDARALTLAAFYYHPALDEARAAAAVARGGITTAGARPNPQIQPSIGYDFNEPPPWMYGFGLTFPIETAGKRGIRIEEATRRAQTAQLQILATAWQVRDGVRRTLIDVIVARRQQDLLNRQLGIQDAIVQLFDRQLAVGAISPFEATQARLSAATTRLAVEQAAIQRGHAEVALADALGLSREAFAPIAALVTLDDDTNVQLPQPQARRTALISRADVRAALSDYEAAQSTLRLEIARQYPDFDLGPAFLGNQPQNMLTVALGLAVPVFNRNQGPIVQASAAREQAAAHLMVVQANALRELNDAETVLAAARLKLTVAEMALTGTREQEHRRQQMYEAGDISRVEVLTAQLETAVAEIAVDEARAQVERAVAALEDAMQSPLGFEETVLEKPQR